MRWEDSTQAWSFGTLHVDDMCVYCGENTAMGSGRFVNRIGADTTVTFTLPNGTDVDFDLDGWMCSECQDGWLDSVGGE